MVTIDAANWNGFLSCLDGLLNTPQVQSMRCLPHHPGVNCYEHSVFVAYVAFRLGRRWGLDYRACARGGLLHDLGIVGDHEHSPTAVALLDETVGQKQTGHPVQALLGLVEDQQPAGPDQD